MTATLKRAVGGIDLSVPSIDIPDVAAPVVGVPVIPLPDPPPLPELAAPEVRQPQIPVPDTPDIPNLPAPKIDQPEVPEPDFSAYKTAALAAGAAAGAGLTVGFLSAAGADVSNDKLAAQLGIKNPQFAADLGKIAGRLYADAYGENLGQVNEALRGVLQGGLVAEDETNAGIQSVTAKVLDLASAFDQDLGAVASATGQLLKTGMAKDATEALDIVTRGFQQGADKSGDFLDTLNEYGTQFRKLGIDGKTATALLTQGLRAGARDSDVVADSIKEFSIRAVDGSKLTAEGFQQIGLDAAAMAAQIGKGGPEAAAGLDAVLDRLRAMPDPLARSEAAVALFGTQAEDLGEALFALDPSEAVDGLGDVAGAADHLGATLAGNATTGFEKFRRGVETKLAGVAQAFGPVLDIAPALGGLALAGQAVAGPLKAVGGGLLSVGQAAVTGAAGVIGQTAAFVGQKVAAVASAAATKAMAAAQWVLNAAMSANPITLVVIAIAALVAGFVLAYKHSETFREIVQTAFGVVLKAAEKVGSVVTDVMGGIVGAFASVIGWLRGNWDVVLTILTGPFGLAILIVRRFGDDIVAFFTGLPGRITAIAGDIFGFIKSQATGAKDWVGGRVSDVVGFFTGLPARFATAAGDVFGFLRESFRSAVNWIIRKWNNIEFGIPGFDIPGPGPNFPGVKFRTPNIPLLHDGGIVPGPRGADVLTILQAGEEVRSVAQVAAGAGTGGASFAPTLNVTVAKEDETPYEIVRRLGALAYLSAG